jgi:proteasome-associated ATPase
MSTYGRYGGATGQDDQIVFLDKRVRDLEARERELMNGLNIAKDRILAQELVIKRMQTPPFPYATVLKVDKEAGSLVVTVEGRTMELLLPDKGEVYVGSTVKVSSETSQVVAVVTGVPSGETHIVRRARGTTCEIEAQGGIVKVVLTGPTPVAEGDRVVLDQSGSVVVQNLGKEERKFVFEGTTNVTWDDIGGLEEAKAEMIEAIELPFKHQELYARYGKKPLKGVLLYGNPGCGKTLLAKATATALAKIHGEKAQGGFIYVKGPEILNRFVGNSEETIRSLFEKSREFKKINGYPAVIFIDECDAVLGKRGTDITTHIERTIVPMFLAEMDGLEESGAVVLLATNRPDILDPAIVRDGRIDRKVKISRPTVKTAAPIFELHLKDKPIVGAIKKLVKRGVDELFSPKRVMYVIEKEKGYEHFTLGEIASGAMIAGIVDRATSIALMRDLTTGKAEGLTEADVAAAVDNVFAQNRDLGHNEDIAEFVRDFSDQVLGVKRASVAV